MQDLYKFNENQITILCNLLNNTQEENDIVYETLKVLKNYIIQNKLPINNIFAQYGEGTKDLLVLCKFFNYDLYKFFYPNNLTEEWLNNPHNDFTGEYYDKEELGLHVKKNSNDDFS